MPSSRRLFVLFGLVLVLAIPVVTVADDAATRAIVEQAIEKKGGEKLAKFKGTTSKVKGTVQANAAGLSFTGEIASQAGDQQRIAVTIVVDGRSISIARVLNRDQGWVKLNDTVVDMPAEELAETKAAAYAGWVATLLPLKDKAFQLAPFGEIEIAGRKVVGVNVTRDGHRSINLFFDKESLRLVRSETIVRDKATSKEMTEEATYGEFKTVEGTEQPTKVSIKRNGQSYADIEVEEYQPAEKLDDSIFAKP